MFTYDDLVDEIDYTSNYHTNLMKVLAYLDPNKSSSYTNWIMVPDNRPQTDEIQTDRCVCGHEIHHKFIAHHIITHDQIVVGSDCIGKFSNETRIKANRLVRQARNPNGIFCHTCLKKTTNGVEHKGHHYHKSCLKCSTCSKLTDCVCTKVKCRDCDTIIINKPKWSIRCYPCYKLISI
jgi:hypothetical protein